jgi:CO/xanthine dehydrogenase FAD-binding subunit
MEYLVPRSLDEALSLLSGPEEARPVAGGTDLACILADSPDRPARLVDLTRLPELQGIRRSAAGIEIGACVTIGEIAASAGLPRCLVQGARAIGSIQIRNIATIGGNVCNASSCGDTLPPLLCLDAVLLLASKKARRELPASEFFLGDNRTALREGELLVGIRIAAVTLEGRSAFRWIGKRNGQAISQVNAAVWFLIRGDQVIEARAAAGSVAPIPIRLGTLEATFGGARLDKLPMGEIDAVVNADIRPRTSLRSTEKFKRLVSVSLIRDAIEEALS